MRRTFGLLICLGVSILTSNAEAAISFLLDGTESLVSYATVNSLFQDQDYMSLSNTSASGGTTTTATFVDDHGDTYLSTTTSVFHTTGDSANFSATFDQTRGGPSSGSRAAGDVNLFFTTNVDVPYSASGSYSNSSGRSNLNSYLFDTTDNTVLYRSQQSDLDGSDAYVLGGMAGNGFNDFAGSLTGTLPANHTFHWYAESSTQRYFDDGGGAMIPEPSPVAACRSLLETHPPHRWVFRNRPACWSGRCLHWPCAEFDRGKSGP